MPQYQDKYRDKNNKYKKRIEIDWESVKRAGAGDGGLLLNSDLRTEVELNEAIGTTINEIASDHLQGGLLGANFNWLTELGAKDVKKSTVFDYEEGSVKQAEVESGVRLDESLIVSDTKNKVNQALKNLQNLHSQKQKAEQQQGAPVNQQYIDDLNNQIAKAEVEVGNQSELLRRLQPQTEESTEPFDPSVLQSGRIKPLEFEPAISTEFLQGEEKIPDVYREQKRALQSDPKKFRQFVRHLRDSEFKEAEKVWGEFVKESELREQGFVSGPGGSIQEGETPLETYQYLKEHGKDKEAEEYYQKQKQFDFYKDAPRQNLPGVMTADVIDMVASDPRMPFSGVYTGYKRALTAAFDLDNKYESGDELRQVGDILLGLGEAGIGGIPKVAAISAITANVMPVAGWLGEEIGGERGRKVAETITELGSQLSFGKRMFLLMQFSHLGSEGTESLLRTGLLGDIQEDDIARISEGIGHLAFVSGIPILKKVETAYRNKNKIPEQKFEDVREKAEKSQFVKTFEVAKDKLEKEGVEFPEVKLDVKKFNEATEKMLKDETLMDKELRKKPEEGSLIERAFEKSKDAEAKVEEALGLGKEKPIETKEPTKELTEYEKGLKELSEKETQLGRDERRTDLVREEQTRLKELREFERELEASKMSTEDLLELRIKEREKKTGRKFDETGVDKEAFELLSDTVKIEKRLAKKKDMPRDVLEKNVKNAKERLDEIREEIKTEGKGLSAEEFSSLEKESETLFKSLAERRAKRLTEAEKDFMEVESKDIGDLVDRDLERFGEGKAEVKESADVLASESKGSEKPAEVKSAEPPPESKGVEKPADKPVEKISNEIKKTTKAEVSNLNSEIEKRTKSLGKEKAELDTKTTELKEKSETLEAKSIVSEEMSKEYQTKDRLISDDAYNKARENILKKTSERLSAGLDPTLMKDLAVVGSYHLESLVRATGKQAVKFADWSKGMIEQYGEKIRPTLKGVWTNLEQHKKKMAGHYPVPMGLKESTTKGYNVKTMHPEVAKKLPDYIEQHKKLFNKMRGNRVTTGQAVEGALEYASTLTTKKIQDLKPGDAKNYIETLGMRVFAENEVANALEQIGKHKSNPNDPLQTTKVQQDLHSAFVTFSKVRNLVTDAARTLKFSGLQVSDRLIKEYRNVQKDLKEIDPQYAKMIDKMMNAPKLSDKVKFWFLNMILSNPFTDLANIGGNTSHFAWNYGGQLFSQSIPTSVAMLKAMKRGMVQGKKDFMKVVRGEMVSTAKFFEGGATQYTFAPKGKVGKVIEKLLPTTRLAAEDAFFRSVAREVETTIGKRKLAKDMGESITEVEKGVQDIIKNPFLEGAKIEKYRELANHIDKQVDFMVFQSKLNKAGQGLSQMADTIPLKFIIPFVKTPSNIIKSGLYHSPYGFTKLLGAKGKNMSKMERREITRRAVAGSTFYTGLTYLMAQGIIEVTGQGPDDPTRNQIWRGSGYDPNHIYINVGGKKMGFSYQNINPMNVPLALAGNMSDNMKYNGKVDDSFWDTASKSLAGMAATISDQSFLSGVSNLTNWMRTGSSNYLERAALSPFIPNIVTVPKNVEQMISGRKPMYETDDVWEGIKNRLGLTDKLRPKLNVFGEIRESGYERFPLPVKTIKMMRLEQFLLDSDLDVSQASKSTKFGDRVMTPEEYNQYVEISGKNIKETLTAMMPKLKKMTKEEAQDEIYKVTREIRTETKKYMKQEQGISTGKRGSRTTRTKRKQRKTR